MLASAVENPDFQHRQHCIDKKFPLKNHLLVLEKEGDILHVHAFATVHQQVDFTNVYLNNMERIRLYCRFFREESASLQKKIDHIKVDLGLLVGPSFYEKPISGEFFATKEAHEEFFLWLKKSHGGIDLIKPLSDREIECLQLLIDGNPASAIGQQLSITVRTAEHHIDNIKNKLSCSTKMDLFSFLKSLKACGGELSFLKFSWDSCRKKID